MCEDLYSEFPPRTIGGPTGDYVLMSDVTSARWVEYRILSVAEGDAGPGAIVVSGKGPPNALKWDGTVTITDPTYIDGTVLRIGATNTIPAITPWLRVVNSQRRVFVRIDTPASTSAYVTIQFRARLLTIIPGPVHEVHPDFAHEINKARAEAIKERIAALGIPAYAEEGD